MQIRAANLKDAEGIANLHRQAFDVSETELIADFAVNLLREKTTINIISLVAINNDEIIGHAAFSPVFSGSTDEHLGYILAPLAVSPVHQNSGIGSEIVKHGLDTISAGDAYIVFVYGDPKYYTRFGFNTALARKFTPPYPLAYPHGWLALKLNAGDFPEDEKLKCVNSLNVPDLW